jgi:hypothetical protein
MNKALFLLPAAAIAMLSLSACENKAEELDSRAPDPQASALANAAPIEQPPTIKSSVTFRCQPGNTLIYADFMSNDTVVNVKTEKTAMPKRLVAPAAGEPFVADGGYKLTGNAKAASIEIAGAAPKACKA